MIGFERQRSFDSYFNTDLIALQGELDAKQIERLKHIKLSWNFYEGYHWDEMPETDGPELTFNYCRPFIDKFVAFELGKSFTITTHENMEGKTITKDGRSIFEYLEDIWEDNHQYQLSTEIGQMKDVTGEAWLQVRYYNPDEIKQDDPYGEYPDGRLKITLLPTSVVFPEFDPHDRDRLLRVTIMYQYEKRIRTGILGRLQKKKVLYKQVWTKDQCAVYDDSKEPEIYPNKYGVIPFVQIRNLYIAGKTEGYGDIEDIIPMNIEYNSKSSDVSEIIDYHAAPVTVVYGAKIGNIEKGANKMWGGLAKDAKVENLELTGDLAASTNYIANLKQAMCEVGGIPESVLGGSQAISNTSGVALQYMNLPLIEKTRIKRMNTEDGFERLNKLILLVSLCEGLISKPSDVTNRDFFYSDCSLPDTLPKDTLIELQQLQLEMKMGIESRKGAAQKMGQENIESLFEEIDEDIKTHPTLYGCNPMQMGQGMNPHGDNPDPQINSGMMNGSTPVEQVRKEMTGSNGAVKS